MRKLINSTFTTLDGVISDPAGYGVPYWDEEHAAYAAKLLSPADSLLLGRKTYEGFVQAWPSRSGGYADKINSMPKIVASNTLTEGTWNATIVSDVVGAVRAAKQEDGGDILKYGTGVLDHTLLENDLIDEFHLWVFPVVAGKGERLLDGIDLTHFDLVDSTTFKSGIVVHELAPKR
jgi:dihydrofolate reductase